jgi:Vitamin K-dependent gamma-carboxylase
VTWSQWRDFWLPRSGPTTLAAVRIIVSVQALWILLSRDPAGNSAMPHAIWQELQPEFHLRFLLVQGIPGIEFMLWILAIASIACVLVGYKTRIFGILASLLLYHIAPLQALLNATAPWGKGLTIATLALPILACSPCEDRWSVARLLRPAPTRDADAYGWAVMLVRLLFAQIYLFTVLARLWAVGWDWAKMETVRNHLLVFGLAEPSLNTSLNAWLIAHPTVCGFLAAGTLMFELLFIVAVFVPVARLPLAIAGFLFHTSLMFTLGFRYPNLMHFLLFIDFNGEAKPKRTPEIAEGERVRSLAEKPS